MDALTGDVSVSAETPLGAELDLLFARHHAFCHADTPPESIHMMDREDLAVPGITFLVLRDAGRPVAMGAVKRLDLSHGEIKSMHVLDEARGRGHAARLLDALVAAAGKQGMTRLSLETGAQPSFAAARALYERAGFVTCPPFGSYQPDPMSVFMTRVFA